MRLLFPGSLLLLVALLVMAGMNRHSRADGGDAARTESCEAFNGRLRAQAVELSRSGRHLEAGRILEQRRSCLPEILPDASPTAARSVR